MQRIVVFLAIFGLALVAWFASQHREHFGYAVLIGGLGGVALYHAAFGFTGAWRRFIRERRAAGLRAQLLLIGLAILMTFPLIGYGAEYGVKTYPWVNAMSLTSALGAFIFGFAMQLGGGCGSGTLFTVGGGSTRMAITLTAFVGGSVLWTGTHQYWRGMPRFERVSLITELGVTGALLSVFALIVVLWLIVTILERRRYGTAEGPREFGSILQGPWPLWLGAALLAVVSIATFLTLGRPWGVTSAFSLWGVKALDTAGVPIQAWNGWSDQRMERSVFANATSVMNFGVMLGALLAAGLAQRFAPTLKLSPRDILTAIIGGLLMGYGARMAGGCNIGGFLGGVVSGSLHGWWWLLFGFAGSWLGVYGRIWTGMDPPIERAA